MIDTSSEPVFWIIVVLIIVALYTLASRKSVRTSIINFPIKISEKLSFKGRLLSEANRVRRKHGLPRLGRTSFLDRVAAKHSKYQAIRRQCSHDHFSSRSHTIMSKTHCSYVGENCYMFPSERYTKEVAIALVRGWMKSKGHRENILTGRYRKTGIGIVVRAGYVYATQVFTD
jgi:uncharacterized protein YkwD